MVTINGCRNRGDGREARNKAGGGGGRGIDDVIIDGFIDVGASGGGNGGDKIVNGGGGGNKYWENFCAYLLKWQLFIDDDSIALTGTQ